MSPANYKEQNFEDHIEEHLISSGYQSVHHSKYDRKLCLIPTELIRFIKETQPNEYDKLTRQYGADTEKKIAERFARVIAKDGVLEVLRKGVRDRGAHLWAVFFKPVSERNPEHKELYEHNSLAVVRQLHYSTQNEKSIDLGLFVNGLPVITAELKNSLTGQTVEQAKKQYREDRDPKEPLLRYKRCLVHFALGNEKVYMTTRLSARKTSFLPFNKDVENPVNPNGHKTAYLWEHFWQKDVLLNLLQNYLHLEVDKEKVYNPQKGSFETIENEKLIFPRYHQYDVVQKLLKAAEEDGPGNSYLVQHSAGSGKSNSIAWLSHGLRQLFDASGKRMYDSIVVITDRRVLDQQLQDTITQFEQVSGTVVPITKTSQQLKESLEKGKDIIVSTLQKFPVISDAISELGGQNFAVVIDEAHSSQTGETAKHLKKTLSVNLEEAEGEDEDGEGEDPEDKVIRNIRERGKQNHISYFAFTATPKNKTLELFGTQTPSGEFRPFHTYDMRQAIAEGFIVDVLRNYSTFERQFKLIKSVEDDREYESQKAVRALTSYVDLQPHAIETKTRIMLGHFLDVTIDAIQGKGRAMLVTRSRLHTVKYFLMFRKIMKEKGLNVKPLVAFSGTVRDPDTGLEHTEHSLNALGQRISIKDAFKLPEYRILIVANKFQTGFDCPPLHTMWVDKKLANVQAVQTLSRLNRKMTGKSADDTVILDFVNEPDDIQKAFQPFYQQTTLVEETDPNKLYDIETELSNLDVYTQKDINDYCEIFYDETQPDELLQPVLDRVVNQWRTINEEDQESFRSHLQSYIRLYGYLGQVIDFTDPLLEKLYVFARSLNRKLPKRESAGLPQEIYDEVDLDSFRIQKRYEGHIQLMEEDGELPGISAEVGSSQEPDVDYLSNIIETLNETFGLELDERDKIRLKQIVEDVQSDESVQAVMQGNNTMTNKRTHVNSVVDQKILDQVNESIDLYQKLSEAHVSEAIKSKLFDKLLARMA